MTTRPRTAPPLGGMTASSFMRRHWQKHPLFVESALAPLHGLLAPADLLALASDERCRSRLVSRRGASWQVRHGPFDPAELRRLPKRNWALLVQDVDTVVRQAHDVMMRFDFIPYARMDDLMISLAPEGGGVGPHFDSYDVFLLQGLGARRWEISAQKDLELRAGLPLRILRDFRPSQAFDCRTGDLLYLPPGVAHDGVALETCMTWSVGFRAASFRELVTGFLSHIEDGLPDEERYGDPDLSPQASPARIPTGMLHALIKRLGELDLSRGNVQRYLGCHLTEPQSHVTFPAPRRPLSRAAFATQASRRGIELALTSRMLWAGADVFINGEHLRPSPAALLSLTRLADERRWPAGPRPDAEVIDAFYDWYRAGYLLIAKRLIPGGGRIPHLAQP